MSNRNEYVLKFFVNLIFTLTTVSSFLLHLSIVLFLKLSLDPSISYNSFIKIKKILNELWCINLCIHFKTYKQTGQSEI